MKGIHIIRGRFFEVVFNAYYFYVWAKADGIKIFYVSGLKPTPIDGLLNYI